VERESPPAQRGLSTATAGTWEGLKARSALRSNRPRP